MLEFYQCIAAFYLNMGTEVLEMAGEHIPRVAQSHRSYRVGHRFWPPRARYIALLQPRLSERTNALGGSDDSLSVTKQAAVPWTRQG